MRRSEPKRLRQRIRLSVKLRTSQVVDTLGRNGQAVGMTGHPVVNHLEDQAGTRTLTGLGLVEARVRQLHRRRLEPFQEDPVDETVLIPATCADQVRLSALTPFHRARKRREFR